MKVEDVPQDPKFTEGTPVRHPVYAVNSEGKYEMVNSLGWDFSRFWLASVVGSRS